MSEIVSPQIAAFSKQTDRMEQFNRGTAVRPSLPWSSPAFSTHIGTACNKQSRTYADLAEKLKMDVLDLMRQVNGRAAPSKALVKGLARELDISEPYLDKLAEEVRKDRGANKQATINALRISPSCRVANVQ
jgi:ribosome-binding protein aMBF1 (putative translation factor)